MITSAGLLQALVQQSSAQRRKLRASSPARRSPRAQPSLPPAGPGPLFLTSPGSPRPGSRAALRPTRVPTSRRPPAPRSAQTAAQGEGRRGPRVPGAAARPLPAPQLSRLPRLNSSRRLPPAARSSPFPGAAAAATPVPGLAPELGRGGPEAPPGRCRGGRSGGRRPGGAVAAPGWGSGRVWWGLRSPIPSLGSLGSRLSAADGRHLGEGEKARATREPQSSPERRLLLQRGYRAGERASSASNKTCLLSAVAVPFENTLLRSRFLFLV